MCFEEYKLYSRAIKGGGAVLQSTKSGGSVVKSTSSGGGSTQTSSSGGGSTQSSSSGGGSTQSSSSGGGVSKSTAAGGGQVTSSEDKTWLEIAVMSGVPQNGVGDENYGYHMHEVRIPGSYFTHAHEIKLPAHSHDFSVPDHSHTVNIPSHTHSVTIPNHTHTVNTPSHTHEIDIPAHTHEIDIPDHTHGIDYGIFKLPDQPTAVQIKVDGNLLPHTAISGDQIDIVPYLAKDSEGRITRGRWVEIEITPNKLGRINASVISQLFLQSRGGGDY
jgi:hypothetical protein